MPHLNQTHDRLLRSWIESANDPDCDFPIQNLPFGVFRRKGVKERPRIGVAIGDCVLDVPGCVEVNLLDAIEDETAFALSASYLNHLMRGGRDAWLAVRQSISHLLQADTPTLRDNAKLRERMVVSRADAELLLPVQIGDYTDFYASIHHAMNIGSMFRPDNPLLPNYKHLPVGYHGRASSIVISGTPIRRPYGQAKADDAELPTFGPSKLLDYELEMGFFVGPGNGLGHRIAMREAPEHIFGMVIVNDWSARDIQKWEYQPLGPFNAKNFATTISPWVVTLDALEPYRVAGAARGDKSGGDPPLREYLKPTDDMGYDITVEVYLTSQLMRDRELEPMLISRGNFTEMYWTIAQMLVHHTASGCNLRPGDLLASGTVSGQTEDSRGCLMERTWRGQNPIRLPDGSDRKFLQDGDEVIIRAYCHKDGAARVGFGDCCGVILPAG
ncbi:MAG: fumarylacetoacetase [Planctomycetes bacterium]|nr:fumarylacetoacetase [Planctomycetota bacterium]